MKNIQKSILELFTFNDKLKFNELVKLLNQRSNKLSYHLTKLVAKGILIKEKDFYKISENSEYLIPYLSDKNSVLTILLIHIGNNKNCFLIKRQKRPFKDKLSLPGGRLLLGETIKKGTSRLMKEKFNLNANLKKINSVSIENLIKKNKILHTYLLVFVTANTYDKIQLVNIEKNKKNIITSDYYLLKKDLSKKTNIKTLKTYKI